MPFCFSLAILQVGQHDASTIAALEKNPDLLPSQHPLHPDLANRTAAIINPIDEMTLDQESMWGNAGHIRYILGRHLSVQAENRAMVSEFACQHLQELLAA
ncbi:MAG: hypothetical protein ACR2LN_06335 [Candidatus Levyibacteriota bacterium]